MFQYFKTLGMILVASITLAACADLAYLFSGDDSKKQPNTRTQQVNTIETQPKTFYRNAMNAPLARCNRTAAFMMPHSALFSILLMILICRAIFMPHKVTMTVRQRFYWLILPQARADCISTLCQ